MSSKPKVSSSVWVPRAVKTIERAAAAANAAVAPAAACAVPSTGGCRADDLDDLADEQPAVKRARGDNEAESEPAVKGEEGAEDEPTSTLSVEDEVISGAPRLAQHIKSASKCIKVAAMAYALLDQQGAVTARSSGAFFEVLEAAMSEPMRPVTEPKFRVAYRKLFEGVQRRRQAFSAEHCAQIDVWTFQLHTALELAQADESFAFTRATRKVMDRIERLKPDAMPPGKAPTDYEPAEAAARWTPALLVCLRTAYLSYGRCLWAKPAVEELVKSAMACRRQWAAEGARQIEEWNQACKGGAVQRKAGGSGHVPFVTSFDKDAARWRSADVSVSKGKAGDGSSGMQN